MGCTFCMECVSACPHDNVILQFLPTGKKKQWATFSLKIKERKDVGFLIALLCFAALANAAAMIEPVVVFEEQLQQAWGFQSVWPIQVIFFLLALVVLPLFLLVIFEKITSIPWQEAVGGLVPLGLAMWTAHFSFHLVTAWSSLNLLIDRFIFQKTPLALMNMGGLEAIQILLLGLGLLGSFYWHSREWKSRRKFIWFAFDLFYYCVAILILLQPMQMRGM